MRYRVYFKQNPHTVTLSPEELERMLGMMNGSTSKEIFYMSGKETFINCLDISHITSENLDENAASSVVKPLKPDEIKNLEKEKHDKLIADPKALIRSVQNKAEGEEENE